MKLHFLHNIKFLDFKERQERKSELVSKIKQEIEKLKENKSANKLNKDENTVNKIEQG